MEGADGVFYILKKWASIELDIGGDIKTLLIKHTSKGLLSGELRLGVAGAAIDDVVSKNFLDRGDGEVGVVFASEVVEILNGIRRDGVIGIDKDEIIAAGALDAGVAGGRKALILLMDGFDARILLFILIAEFI